MRKRIAVFLGELGREFQKEFAKYIKEKANAKGYDVFIFCNFGSYSSTILFDSGERDIVNIPVFSEFDGVISLPDTFDIEGMEGRLLRKIMAQSECPIVSIRNGSPKTYRVTFDDYSTIYEMTNHFIKDHGFTKICYMSGPFSVEDSMKRLLGFKDAMKAAGLPVTDDIIYEGDFWKFQSKPALEQFLNTYDGHPQAIICANDYMALGLCEEIKARGLRIPEDIAISGFDEVIEGRGHTPVLTTVRMPIEDMAVSALNIIESVNEGKEVSQETSIPGNILCKGSCGCDPNYPKMDISIYLNQISDDYINIRTSTLFTVDIQNRISEEEKLSFISTYTERFKFHRTYLCLCNGAHKDDNPYSDNMLLRAVFPLSDELNSSPLVNSTFERKYILPEGAYDSTNPSCFLVFPVHHKNTTYGYIVSDWGDLAYSCFIAPYTEGIALAYNDLYQQMQYSELAEIKRQSLIDPLTGLNNRRGFEQSLASVVNGEVETDIISFISADMDNLKMINDNYGHMEGDVAIKTFADVLVDMTGENDICCRAGGDEFYVVLVSNNPKDHETFSQRVTDELRLRNERLNKNYSIHASVGVVTIDKSQLDKTYEHINLADKRMYDIKKEYKKTLLSK